MKKSNVFTGKNLALAAMFAAVSYGLSFLEFPIFPAAPYLKLDFSFSVQLIGAYMLGPILGEMVVVIVQLLRLLTSSTGGVGELANFIAATCFVCVPSVIYRFKKGLPIVFISIFIGTVLQIGASLLSNRFLTFPLYMGAGAESAFNAAFWLIVAFNAVKCSANAVITLLLYKRLKKLFFRGENKGNAKTAVHTDGQSPAQELNKDTEKRKCDYCGNVYEGDRCPTCGCHNKQI